MIPRRRASPSPGSTSLPLLPLYTDTDTTDCFRGRVLTALDECYRSAAMHSSPNASDDNPGPSTTHVLPNMDSGPAETSNSQAADTSPLLVALTGYRLLNIAVILIFGTVKAVLTLYGYSILPTTFEWVIGVLFAIA